MTAAARSGGERSEQAKIASHINDFTFDLTIVEVFQLEAFRGRR
jgi:hypothetical protein